MNFMIMNNLNLNAFREIDCLWNEKDNWGLITLKLYLIPPFLTLLVRSFREATHSIEP